MLNAMPAQSAEATHLEAAAGGAAGARRHSAPAPPLFAPSQGGAPVAGTPAVGDITDSEVEIVARAALLVEGADVALVLPEGASPLPPGDSHDAGLHRSDSGSGLPLLLLSPQFNMPPSSLLPMPPLGVTSGDDAAASAAAKGNAGAAAAVHDDADWLLLQQHYRPSSSKLTELFKPLEEQQAVDSDGDDQQTAAAQNVEHASPRSASELRAAILRLAQQSPQQRRSSVGLFTALVSLPALPCLPPLAEGCLGALPPLPMPLPMPAPQPDSHSLLSQGAVGNGLQCR